MVWHYPHGCMTHLIGKTLSIWYEWWLFEHLYLVQGWEEDYPCPFKPFTTPQNKLQKNLEHLDLFLNFSEPLLKASYHEFRAFKESILISHDESESSFLSYTLSITVLDHSAHVLPEDIPSGLAPKEVIQHHIDLIPRVILPNKPTYMMNPKETIEVQRQVDELISKWFVRESLSLRASPALLVPKKDERMRMYG